MKKYTESKIAASMRKGLTLRGRYFSPDELRLICSIVRRYFKKGRTFASVEICKRLAWTQPNGWPKDRACREVLKRLAAKRILVLPKYKNRISRHKVKAKIVVSSKLLSQVDKTPISAIEFSTLRLCQVKGTKQEPIWNHLVRRYHYLGFRIFVGRSLKYLVCAGERIIGALGFCDPAWSLASRDQILEKLGYDINILRLRGINNGRFLILPWVNVTNLASRILSVAIRRVEKDWTQYYGIAPLFLETFVDPGRYAGTCYKASNWNQVGETAGYSKSGNAHRNSQAPKSLFIYPFDRRLASQMTLK